MSKKICTVCKGNGFVRVPYSLTREEVWANCDFCNSQGEIETEDENGRSRNDGSNKTN
jgi:DnaJ-class molecular chaperone